eukprot:4842392-Amphidinium_carterae.1
MTVQEYFESPEIFIRGVAEAPVPVIFFLNVFIVRRDSSRYETQRKSHSPSLYFCMGGCLSGDFMGKIAVGIS